MKKFWKWIIGGILVCVLAIFGIKNITKKVEVQPINNNNKQEQNIQNDTHQQNTQNMESQNTNKQEKLEQSKEKSVLVSVAPIQSGILNQNYQYIGSLLKQ